MNELAVVQVDAILSLIEAFRLTPNEIVKLSKAGHEPVDLEGYYMTAQEALQWRTDTHPQASKQIEDLVEMALYDGITLTVAAPDVALAYIPIFGLGL